MKYDNRTDSGRYTSSGKRKKKKSGAGKVIGRTLLIVLETLLLIVAALYVAMYVVVNGPSVSARKMFVASVRETSAIGFLANLYMSEEEILELERNNVSDEYIPTDTTLINVEPIDTTETGTSGHWEIADLGLIDDDDDGIIVDRVVGEGYSGYMMLVRDPSRVIMGSIPASFGGRGYTVAEYVEKFDAVAGTNAGGFLDANGQGNGATPDTMVVFEGKVYYAGYGTRQGFAGIDSNYVLHVGNFSQQDIYDNDIQYGAAYGPVLIQNGEAKDPQEFNNAVNPRTAIGQRADGVILLLVIDGRQVISLGARYSDLVSIMVRYGAVNACNMDGGSSSLLWYQGDYINNCASVIGIRPVPTSWMVLKEGVGSNG